MLPFVINCCRWAPRGLSLNCVKHTFFCDNSVNELFDKIDVAKPHDMLAFIKDIVFYNHISCSLFFLYTVCLSEKPKLYIFNLSLYSGVQSIDIMNVGERCFSNVEKRFCRIKQMFVNVL